MKLTEKMLDDAVEQVKANEKRPSQVSIKQARLETFCSAKLHDDTEKAVRVLVSMGFRPYQAMGAMLQVLDKLDGVPMYDWTSIPGKASDIPEVSAAPDCSLPRYLIIEKIRTQATLEHLIRINTTHRYPRHKESFKIAKEMVKAAIATNPPSAKAAKHYAKLYPAPPAKKASKKSS